MTEKNKSCDAKPDSSCSDSKATEGEPQTADLKDAVEVLQDKSAPSADKKDAHSLIDETAHEAKKAESFKPAKPEKDVKAS